MIELDCDGMDWILKDCTVLESVAGSVLTDDEPGYFKEEPGGEILEEGEESKEDEQEIVKELAMDILFSKCLN